MCWDKMDKSDTADTDKNIDELSVKPFIILLLTCLSLTADCLDLLPDFTSKL